MQRHTTTKHCLFQHNGGLNEKEHKWITHSVRQGNSSPTHSSHTGNVQLHGGTLDFCIDLTESRPLPQANERVQQKREIESCPPSTENTTYTTIEDASHGSRLKHAKTTTLFQSRNLMDNLVDSSNALQHDQGMILKTQIPKKGRHPFRNTQLLLKARQRSPRLAFSPQTTPVSVPKLKYWLLCFLHPIIPSSTHPEHKSLPIQLTLAFSMLQ